WVAFRYATVSLDRLRRQFGEPTVLPSGSIRFTAQRGTILVNMQGREVGIRNSRDGIPNPVVKPVKPIKTIKGVPPTKLPKPTNQPKAPPVVRSKDPMKPMR